MALIFALEVLAQMTSLFMLVISVLVNLALFCLKQTQPPPPEGTLNLSIWIPLAGFAVSAVFGSFVAIDLVESFAG